MVGRLCTERRVLPPPTLAAAMRLVSGDVGVWSPMPRLSARVRADWSESLQQQVFVKLETVCQLPRLCCASLQACWARAH